MKSKSIRLVLAIALFLPVTVFGFSVAATEKPGFPQSYPENGYTYHHFNYTAGDTIPTQKPAPSTNPVESQPAAKADPVVQPVIKIVPKSRRQIKPVPVPKTIPVKPVKIVKPKIVIKAGLIK